MKHAIVIIMCLLLTGCGYPQPNAEVSTPEIVTVGEPATLNASGTTLDRDATYTWTVDKAPSGSTATVDNPHAKKTTITPDVVGRYEITVTVENKVWSDAQTITLTVLPELADGVTELGVLVIHSQDEILGWQIDHTLDEAGDIIAQEYPDLNKGWAEGSITATAINVPIADTAHPERYQVVDWEVGRIPTE